MQQLLRAVGSLKHLVAFEAAARRCSFTLAAEELGVSQPAVSQAVRSLERTLGFALFDREHRSIRLTPAGEKLQSDVQDSFARILQGVRQLKQQHGGRHVTLSVSAAFANYWMVPRLQNFREAHPDVDLRVQQTERDLDLAQEGISLAIWRGDGRWNGYDSHPIAREAITAVASDAWVACNAPVETLDDLAQAQRITLEEPFRFGPSWRDFFRAHGRDIPDRATGLRLNDYSLVLQAALAGEGVAFGWQHITQPLVRAGLLVQVGPWRWDTDKCFHLVWSSRVPLSNQALAFRDWVIATESVC